MFRESGMNTYLIAKEQAVSDTHTIVNLQGKIDMKYAVSIQFSEKPRRAAFAEGWPKSKEENTTRLAEAGFILDRMVQKCSNCGGLYRSIHLQNNHAFADDIRRAWARLKEMHAGETGGTEDCHLVLQLQRGRAQSARLVSKFS